MGSSTDAPRHDDLRRERLRRLYELCAEAVGRGEEYVCPLVLAQDMGTELGWTSALMILCFDGGRIERETARVVNAAKSRWRRRNGARGKRGRTS